MEYPGFVAQNLWMWLDCFLVEIGRKYLWVLKQVDGKRYIAMDERKVKLRA